MVGNAPTTATFGWTWISFCFTFFCFGLVLFVYHRYIRGYDSGFMDPVLLGLRDLSPSQCKVSDFVWCLLTMRALNETDHTVEKLSPGSAVARINKLFEASSVNVVTLENASVHGSFNTGADSPVIAASLT